MYVFFQRSNASDAVVMKECCDEQNALKSEICAITKIRGELYKMKGVAMFITDCQVSDFTDGACSASCGGGTLTKTRSILVHPVNGMACPPLELKVSKLRNIIMSKSSVDTV